MKKRIIYFTISQEDGWYIAEGNNIPVVTHGKTLDELQRNIQEATALALEGEDPALFDLEKEPSILFNVEIPHIHA